MSKAGTLVFISILAMSIGWSTTLRHAEQENTALKRDLAKAQARLDEFYDGSMVSVKLNDLSLKAIPDLGRTDSGYLVLNFSRIAGSEMCEASFREALSKDLQYWREVGEPFPCPDFSKSH